MKVLKKIFSVIKTLVLIILVLFIVAVVLQRVSDNKVSFFKFRMFSVISGSMEPKYKVGDVLISREVKPSKIKVGDAVSYLGTKGSFINKVVTHEVVQIDHEDGKYFFHTQGLANLIEDPIVNEDQIYGVVIYRAILLSFVYKIVSTKIGFFLLIIIPLFIIIGSELLLTLLDKEEAKRNKGE